MVRGSREEMNVKRQLEERGLRILTKLIRSSPPDGYQEIKCAPEDAAFRVLAMGRGGEPHIVKVSVVAHGSRLLVDVVCCPHFEAVAEEILELNDAKWG